jgi:hypothetical protein
MRNVPGDCTPRVPGWRSRIPGRSGTRGPSPRQTRLSLLLIRIARWLLRMSRQCGSRGAHGECLARKLLADHGAHHRSCDRSRHDPGHESIHASGNVRRPILGERRQAFGGTPLGGHRLHGHVRRLHTHLGHRFRQRRARHEHRHVHTMSLQFHVEPLSEIQDVRLHSRGVGDVRDTCQRADGRHQEDAPRPRAASRWPKW